MIIFCFTLNMKKKQLIHQSQHTRTLSFRRQIVGYMCRVAIEFCFYFHMLYAIFLLHLFGCFFCVDFIWQQTGIYFSCFFFFFHLFCSFYFTFKLNSLICVCVSPSFYHCFKLFDAKIISFFVLTLFNAFQLFWTNNVYVSFIH